MRRVDQIRHQVAPRSDKRQRSYTLLVREPSSGRFFDELGRFSTLSPRLRTLQSTAPASKNEGSAHRAARRVARTMLPRKTTKIECKIGPKSIEVGRSGYIEAPKSIEVGRSGSVEAPKSIEVGCSTSQLDQPARPRRARVSQNRKNRKHRRKPEGSARSNPCKRNRPGVPTPLDRTTRKSEKQRA